MKKEKERDKMTVIFKFFPDTNGTKREELFSSLFDVFVYCVTLLLFVSYDAVLSRLLLSIAMSCLENVILGFIKVYLLNVAVATIGFI